MELCRWLRSLNEAVNFAIFGHCREPEFFRAEAQYAEVAAARKKFDIPIFNTGEIEFPVERHVMMITTPGNREFELLRSLVPRFCRRAGAVGIDTAMEELAFVEKNWGDQCFMVFNHPNAPDVSLENLLRLAQSPVFKVLACVDRGERRAPQTWDVGGEWDQLLCRGCRISARCGSDFHRHFTDGGHDYYPGEFVQDVLLVEKNDYPEIFAAAIPICGTVNPTRLKAAKDVKFRIFHGDADTVVPINGSRQAYKALKAVGADVKYTEFPGTTHGSWNPAFNLPDFMSWLFSQKKK